MAYNAATVRLPDSNASVTILANPDTGTVRFEVEGPRGYRTREEYDVPFVQFPELLAETMYEAIGWCGLRIEDLSAEDVDVLHELPYNSNLYM